MHAFQKTTLHAVLAFAFCAPALAQTTGAPVRVGAVVSVSGPLAPVGVTQREGYQLAEKVINQRGGINGRPLQLVFEDDSSNPDVAVTKVNGLLNSGAVAILGPTGLAGTLATGGIT